VLAGQLSGPRIAVVGRQSAETLVAVLAVMRGGAAFVPIDPEWPDARVQAVLSAADVSMVVSAAPGRWRGIAVPGAEADESAIDGNDLVGPHAWVMFTSGSTGTPRGVVVGQQAAVSWLDWNHCMQGAREHDRVIWTASLGFGGSIRQMFSPLASGGECVPAPEGLRRDPEALLRFLADEAIAVWNVVPTLWVRVMDAMERRPTALPALRTVIIGGETVLPAHLNRWLALVGPRGPSVVNAW
jgi:non-ribosomal peptide synthetase component F